jgi:hypothetical protein
VDPEFEGKNLFNKIHNFSTTHNLKKNQLKKISLKNALKDLNNKILSFYSNNYLCTCDLYTPVHNVLEGWIYITWGSWKVLGPGIPEFFGPCEMASSR